MDGDYAEIIPIRRMTRKLAVFDYRIPGELKGKIKKGHLVKINFLKTSIQGVVLNIKNDSIYTDNKIKYIDKLMTQTPVINNLQFKIIEWISRRYFVSMAIVAKSMIPIFPKKESKASGKYFIDKMNVSVPKSYVSYISKGVDLLRKNKTVKYYLGYPQKNIIYAYYLGIATHAVKNNKTMLIVCPDIIESNKIYSNLAGKIPVNKIALISSGIKNYDYFQLWKKIKENKISIIIGTRIACFLPIEKLNYAIVHLEEDDNHKQSDINPRFNAREVLMQMAEYLGATAVLTGQTPSLETYKGVTDGIIEKLPVPPFPSYDVKLINMEQEKINKNYSPISEVLIAMIKKTLEKEKSVFLFDNRRGYGGSLYCRECQWIARCPDCRIPYFGHNEGLLCHHCGKIAPEILRCENCQNANLKSLGHGTQKIEAELKKYFPDKSIFRADKDSRITGEIKQGIIIGTEYAISNLKLPDLGLIGIINADSMLSLPDFRSEERTFRIINKIANICPQPVKMAVQTFTPENKAIMALQTLKFDDFAVKELEIRKIMHWPPYYQLIKIIIKNKNEVSARSSAVNIYDKMAEELRNNPVELAGPLAANPPKARGNYIWNIYLKIGINYNIEKLIDIIPQNTVVDADPIKFL